MEVAFVAMAMVFIVPKFEWMAHEGMMGDHFDDIRPWYRAVVDIARFAANNGILILIVLTALWALFEWRVRSENKSFIRISIMGTAAVLLLGLVTLTAGVLVIPAMTAIEMVERRAPERPVMTYLSSLDSSLKATQQAIAAKDWDAVTRGAAACLANARRLENTGAAAPVIVASADRAKVSDFRERIVSARRSLSEALDAAFKHDEEALLSAMQSFHEAYDPLRTAATQPATAREPHRAVSAK
jgi:hypothetical protein